MEDLIDFPVSDDWLDFYHRRGLTPRNSGRLSPEVKALYKQMEQMNKRMEMLENQFQEIIKIQTDILNALIQNKTVYKQKNKRKELLEEIDSLLSEVDRDET